MSESSSPSGRAAHWSATRLARVLGPMQEFIHQAQSGGLVLLAVTVVALLLANTGLAHSYETVLQTHAGIAVGNVQLDLSLHHWINDGLMAIFFFLIGLEIKRELLVGELARLRAAALPIIAAIGGVAVPAGIYALFNQGGPGARGWGIPMATDIAFALGCLALLGSRVPFALKVFLTAVAIVDDLIAVLVIAIFYSGQLNLLALAGGLGLLAVLLGANHLGIRTPLVYIAVGVVVWLAFLASGIHATLAGVAVALTIPARHRINGATFVGRAHALIRDFPPDATPATQMLTDEAQQSIVLELEDLCEQVQAPLQKLEHQLHGWVTWLIMPIFALANAGVALSLSSLRGPALPIFLGVVAGLVVGKPVGLVGASWLAVRFGWADLPAGVSWSHMLGAGLLAGIGFTMSIFIASLGLTTPEAQAAAKAAILLASLIAGAAGLLLLRRLPAAAAADVDLDPAPAAS